MEPGIVACFENDPSEPTVAVAWDPSGSVIVTVSPHVYPVPDIVTVSPTFPLVGDRDTDWVMPVAVKFAEAWLVASVAVTLFAPDADVAGAVNVTPLNDPDASVAGDAGDVTTVVPSYFIVMPLFAPKLLPDTVTVVGTPWLVGESSMVDDDTTNAELAVLVPSVEDIV